MKPKWLSQLIPALLALTGCHGQQDSASKTDRFTGFTQVGQEGEAANLFIDTTTVSRGKEGWVSFKMVRVLPSGYAIQDATTNCRNAFRAMEGVKFRDDGTSEAKFPGDNASVTFQDNPGINAAVNLACT
jgi:hypothetical protein